MRLIDPVALRPFLEAYLYEESAFLVDEVALDDEGRRVEARMRTTRCLPYSDLQRTGPHHPAHVSGSDLLALTGNLGCLHAWFFYGCRFDQGWTGFGNRIHQADFKTLARIGPPLTLASREVRARRGTSRLLLRFEFEFRQDNKLVYFGDQTAMFLKEPTFEPHAEDRSESFD